MPESVEFKERDNIVDQLTDEQKLELSQMVASRWKNSTTDIAELLQDSKEAWDFYLRNHPKPETLASGTKKKDNYEVRASARKGLRLGYIPKAVDSLLAQQHNATFPQDERFFKGTPRNDFSEANQELFEAFLAENFGEANTIEEFRKQRLNMVLDGTACLFTKWDVEETKNKTIYEPISIKLPTPVGTKSLDVPFTDRAVKRDVVEWEGTKVEALDFTDWRVDPTARCYDDSWFIRRWYDPVWKVKKTYPDAKEVKPYHASFPEAYDNDKRGSAGLEDLVRSMNKDDEPDGAKQCLLMVMYDDIVLGDEMYENHLVVVLNDSEVVWFGPNKANHGRKPYIVAPYIPIPGQLYGLSAVKHAIPAAEVIDKAVDEILRIGAWAAKPVFLKNVKDKAVQKHGTIDVKPGMTLPVMSDGAYAQLQVNLANMPVLEAIINKAEMIIQDVTGSNTFMAGDAPQAGDTTAFEVDQRVQGGNSRFMLIMSTFDNMVLEPFLAIAYENFKQYKSADENVNGQTLTRDMFKKFDFKWVITSTRAALTRNKQIANKKALLFEIMPMLVQSGVVHLKPQNIEADQFYALTDFLGTAGITNADKIFKLTQGEPGFITGDNPFATQQGDTNGVSAVPPTPNTAAIDNAGRTVEAA